MNKIEVFKEDTQNIQYRFTSLEEDLFTPVGMYINKDQLPIIFDSRCSVSVSPVKEGFGDTLTMTSGTKKYKV